MLHVCDFHFFYFAIPFMFQIRQYLFFNSTNDHQTEQIQIRQVKVVRLGFGSSIHETEFNLKIFISNRS